MNASQQISVLFSAGGLARGRA